MLLAVEFIRRMRGGAQSQLLRCNDGSYYVVKFQNNPQGPRVLANELLAARLAGLLGLPTQQGSIVEVPDSLIRGSKEMVIELGRANISCQAGSCFGSHYSGTANIALPVCDFLPETLLGRLRNISAFVGMLVFDQWACNADNRQVIFVKRCSRSYDASMIDHGLCFNGSKWDFPDSPLRGMYFQPSVYQSISAADFEHWIRRVEELRPELIMKAAYGIPPEWCFPGEDALGPLLDRLIARRGRIRELVDSTRKAMPQIFQGAVSICEEAAVD